MLDFQFDAIQLIYSARIYVFFMIYQIFYLFDFIVAVLFELILSILSVQVFSHHLEIRIVEYLQNILITTLLESKVARLIQNLRLVQ